MRDWTKGEPPSRKTDLEILSKLVVDHGDELTDDERSGFESIRARMRDNPSRLMTEKERSWAKSALDRLSPQYENLVSSGAVSGKTTVPTIDILKRENLPLRPPGRR